MKFSPKTEKEVAGRLLLDPGRYKFEVAKSTDEVSAKGNEMIHIVLKVYGKGADEVAFVHDYLLESMAHKLRHFAYAVGLGIKYEAGTLSADDCFGRSGTVALRHRKDDGYDTKNEVQDYIVPEGYDEQKEAVGKAVMKQGKGLVDSAGRDLSDSDIPFAPGFPSCCL